jgi:hypothetical protein
MTAVSHSIPWRHTRRAVTEEGGRGTQGHACAGVKACQGQLGSNPNVKTKNLFVEIFIRFFGHCSQVFSHEAGAIEPQEVVQSVMSFCFVL